MPIEPIALTMGQAAAVKQITNKKIGLYRGERLVNYIRTWLITHKVTNQGDKTKTHLPLFQPKNDKQLREFILTIAAKYKRPWKEPDFQDALSKVTMKASQYRSLHGVHGTVPQTIVEAVCTQYKISTEALEIACSRYAAVKDENGIKVLGDGTAYIAELKILVMGNERIFASQKVNGRFVFNKIEAKSTGYSKKFVKVKEEQKGQKPEGKSNK